MCFFCPISNAKQCGGSCGLCGDSCPGADSGIYPGMKESDYDEEEF